jgi:hypothetical protein
VVRRVLLGFLLAACSERDGEPIDQAQDSDQPRIVTSIPVPDAGPDAYVPPPKLPDDDPKPMPPDGSAERPIVACFADGDCVLPPSQCADQDWLTYYTNGECVEGLCSWQENFFYCADGCSDCEGETDCEDGCTISSTA